MALSAPRICCLDLDTFFVSVERLLDPSLIGQPVVVGGSPGERGVVTSASYEVRALGVRSGMSLTQAHKLAPHAIYVPTHHDLYGDYAQRVREIAQNYTPVSQVASIDELYLDFSGCENLYRAAGDADPDATILRVVKQLTQEIKTREGLPASAGIGTSRALAKVASGLAKPCGVVLVRAGTEAAFLADLPVRKYPGIGPVAEAKLQAAGLMTLGALASAPAALLSRIFGAWGESIRRGCLGESSHVIGPERPAFQEHDAEGCAVGSISNERTFREDVRDGLCLEAQLCALVERVCWRARKRGVVAGTVTLKLRYADFETLTRSRSLPASSSEREVLPVVRALLQRARRRRAAVRLLGIKLSKLSPPRAQLSLFADDMPLRRAVDDVRTRYGYEALRTGLSIAHKRARS